MAVTAATALLPDRYAGAKRIGHVVVATDRPREGLRIGVVGEIGHDLSQVVQLELDGADPRAVGGLPRAESFEVAGSEPAQRLGTLFGARAVRGVSADGREQAVARRASRRLARDERGVDERP